MKLPLLLLALSIGAVAQNAPTNPLVLTAENPALPAEKLTRIDLNFIGGSPSGLVEAISKAMGRPLNVIIDEGDTKVHLPPIRVQNATVPDIFSALSTATTREVAVPSGRDGFGNKLHQFRQVRSQFMPNKAERLSDDTVWSFVSDEADTERAFLDLKEPKPSLRHYQLGSYLSDQITVEDITTTIRTGWELIGVIDQPQLKFHKETGILIAAGDGELLDDIPMVLQQLPTSASASPGVPKPAFPPAVPRANPTRIRPSPGGPEPVQPTR